MQKSTFQKNPGVHCHTPGFCRQPDKSNRIRYIILHQITASQLIQLKLFPAGFNHFFVPVKRIFADSRKVSGPVIIFIYIDKAITLLEFSSGGTDKICNSPSRCSRSDLLRHGLLPSSALYGGAYIQYGNHRESFHPLSADPPPQDHFPRS